VSLGLVIGTVAAVYPTRLLAAQLYGVRAGDPRTLGVVAAPLAAAALLASYLPARRATRAIRWWPSERSRGYQTHKKPAGTRRSMPAGRFRILGPEPNLISPLHYMRRRKKQHSCNPVATELQHVWSAHVK
jgi:hypothetical protein